MFDNIYKNKKVLITGNTGFKGSWLTLWLLNLGAKVYGISSDIPTTPSMFEALGLENEITYFKNDIRSLKDSKEIIDNIKPDFLFHLAAQSLVSESYQEPVNTITTNVLGTTNVLESLRNINHKCVGVIITSDKCYDNVEWLWGYKETDHLGGKDVYSGSKGAAEMIIKSYFYSFFTSLRSNIRIASTRAGNVIGGGDWAKDRIVPDCMAAWAKNEVVNIRSPFSTRPWQHVFEPLSGYLTLGMKLKQNSSLNGEAYNFGPPANQNYPVKRLIQEMQKHWTNVQWKDVSAKEKSFHEAGLLKLNCDKALVELDWTPSLNFSETVKMTTEWYKAFYQNQGRSMQDFSLAQIEKYMSIASSRGVSWTMKQ